MPPRLLTLTNGRLEVPLLVLDVPAPRQSLAEGPLLLDSAPPLAHIDKARIERAIYGDPSADAVPDVAPQWSRLQRALGG